VGQCTGPSRRPGELLEQRAPEGWALGYRAVLEQCLESCSLWEGHAGSVQEVWHPTGVTPRWAKIDHKGAAEMKY